MNDNNINTKLQNADAKTVSEAILKMLDDDQAQDILCIDLVGKSSVADIMIIASGKNQRHVGAVAEHIVTMLKDMGLGKAKVEGLPNADWVLIDSGDVVTHIFKPDVREFYSIERIWTGESKHLSNRF